MQDFNDSRLLSILCSNTDTLPLVLFTKEELNDHVLPLLEPGVIRTQLKRTLEKLANIEGFGQAKMIAADPLELRNFVLKKVIKNASFLRTR